MAKVKLIPPDPNRCQSLKRKGINAFRIGDVPGPFVRCRKKPVCIVKELKPNSDGQRGSMSLCSECEPHLYEQRKPSEFNRTPITKGTK
jgi:hypothetical protein